MRRVWEYTYVLVEPADDPCEELNKLGREGCELVSTVPDNPDNFGVHYLKREVDPHETRD